MSAQTEWPDQAPTDTCPMCKGGCITSGTYAPVLNVQGNLHRVTYLCSLNPQEHLWEKKWAVVG